MATKKPEANEETVSDIISAADNDNTPRSIVINYNGSELIVEYNRESVALLEDKLGVNIAGIMNGEISLTSFPNLIYTGLLMHHRNIKRSTVETLIDNLENKSELMIVLIKMVIAAVNSMFEDPEEGKAISWTQR